MQEREIVRILLNYGAELATWEGDGDIPVAPLLLSALDDITFEDKASAYIVDVFRKKAEEYEIPDTRFFFSHEDKDVQDLAITCVSTPYELSPNWNDDKRKICEPGKGAPERINDSSRLSHKKEENRTGDD